MERKYFRAYGNAETPEPEVLALDEGALDEETLDEEASDELVDDEASAEDEFTLAEAISS